MSMLSSSYYPYLWFITIFISNSYMFNRYISNLLSFMCVLYKHISYSDMLSNKNNLALILVIGVHKYYIIYIIYTIHVPPFYYIGIYCYMYSFSFRSLLVAILYPSMILLALLDWCSSQQWYSSCCLVRHFHLLIRSRKFYSCKMVNILYSSSKFYLYPSLFFIIGLTSHNILIKRWNDNLSNKK